MSKQSDKDLANIYLGYYVGLYPQDRDAIDKAVKIIEIVGAAHGEKPHKDYQGEFLDVPCTTMEINTSDASIYDPEHIYQVYWRGIGPSPIRWKNGYMYNREEIEQKVAELQEELADKSSVNSSRERKVSNMRSNKCRLNSNVDSVFEIPRRSILNQMNHWTGGQIADEINDYLSETNPTIRVTNAFFTGNMLGIEYTAPNTDEAEDAFYYVLSDKYTPLNSSRNLNSSEQSALTTLDIYDEVEEYVRDKVFAAVLDVQDTCQRNVIMQAVPEYDPEWCAEEWTDEDDDKQLEACTALLDLIMGGLFRHANLKD